MQTDEDLFPSINNFMLTDHIPCNGYNCCCHRMGTHSHVQHVVVITTPCCCNSRNIAPRVHYNNRPRNAIERQVPTAPEMRLSVTEALPP
uniref:Uncharacterized protein n=1 Tax=Acrobeloides nanus TaxID=290746 RepID=A0A914DW98_9BILA